MLQIKACGRELRFSVEIVFSRRIEKLRRGNLLCCASETYRQRKGLRIGEGESIKICLGNFLVAHAENFQVFQRFRVSKTSYNKSGCAGTTIFRRNCLVSGKKNFVAENLSLLCFRKFPAVKSFCRSAEGEEYPEFAPKIFCPKTPNKNLGKSISVSLISGIEKCYR